MRIIIEKLRSTWFVNEVFIEKEICELSEIFCELFDVNELVCD